MSQFINGWNGQNGMMASQWDAPTPTGAYPQQTQPMQNTQPQNMAGFKAYSPPPQRPPLVGRWVNNFEEITPQDVPMNGSICFFPQTDRSCIYAMVWSNDGKIIPYRFLPERNEPQVSQQQPLPAEMNDILKGYENISMRVADRLDSFDKRLDDILAATQRPSRAKASNTNDKEEK